MTAFELVFYKKGPFRRVVVVVFEEKVDGKDLYGIIDETIEWRELKKQCFFSVKNAIRTAKTVSGKINLVLPQIFVLTEIIFVKALINVHLKYMNTDFYGRAMLMLKNVII
ncbi:hypothetical protein ACTNDG_11485 [Clostridium sp. HCP1S3_B4]|uniref:hypothetical protein n=1 Tax=unclassified Clostridium TaxID=2614128 RepID=UPI003F8C65E9